VQEVCAAWDKLGRQQGKDAAARLKMCDSLQCRAEQAAASVDTGLNDGPTMAYGVVMLVDEGLRLQGVCAPARAAYTRMLAA
jgi:hypothetical protein